MNKFYLIENDFNRNRSVKAQSFHRYVELNFNLVNSVNEADYILVLGGDGSMLSAIQKYKNLNIPFVGISTGTIGYYLHNFEYIEDIKNLIDSSLEIITFPLLKFEARNIDGNVLEDTCFADVWIERNKPQCLKYNISVFHKNKEIYKNKEIIIGDGILFSTPIGSTGYAKNIDDHILPIDLPIFQVVPIASSINKHHFKSFPLCLNNSTVNIEVENSDFRESRLIYDGILSDLKNLSDLKIMKSTDTVKIAFLSSNDFRTKNLSWIIN